MKEEKTGIVRRIDALGRVVVPKEMRKILRWEVNDPLEMYTERGELIIKKYAPMKSVAALASEVGAGIAEQSEQRCIITDTDNVVYDSKSSGLTGKNISEELCAALKEGKSLLILKSEGGRPLQVAKGENLEAEFQIMVPIIKDGYYYGSVIIFGNEKEKYNVNSVKLLRLGAYILAEQV